jgi:multidrug efflux pump subunit AcrA (membrane-fusion protein)
MADSEYAVHVLNPGTVIKKLVKEGDTIRKNQVLYVINNTAPAARLDAANISYLRLGKLSPGTSNCG